MFNETQKVSSGSQASHLEFEKSHADDDFKRMLISLISQLELHTNEEEADFSHDLEVQELMRAIEHRAPDIFPHPLHIPADFIFSKLEMAAILNKCKEKSGKEVVYEGLNLGYNPVLQILDTIVRSTEIKTYEMLRKTKLNDQLVDKSSKLSDLANKLRIDEKDERGVDYTTDPAAQKLIVEIQNEFPTLFGNVKVDENGQITQFKFSHQEVEALKISLSEKSTMILARQKPNESEILSALQENNLQNEIALQAQKNHEKHLDFIQSNIRSARSGG